MFNTIKNLFLGNDPTIVMDSVAGLPPPSKKALAKRDKAAKEAIKKLGSKYMNVPFKGETEAPVNEIEQARRKKSA